MARPGLIYGPYVDFGISAFLIFLGLAVVGFDASLVIVFDTVTNVLTVASVYGYMKKPMKSL